MVTELTAAMRETIQSAARKLTGFWRRQFQAGYMEIRVCENRPLIGPAPAQMVPLVEVLAFHRTEKTYVCPAAMW